MLAPNSVLRPSTALRTEAAWTDCRSWVTFTSHDLENRRFDVGIDGIDSFLPDIQIPHSGEGGFQRARFPRRAESTLINRFTGTPILGLFGSQKTTSF